MTFVSLFVFTALCLFIPLTRTFAMIGLMLLLYLFPYSTTGALLLVAVGFYFIYWRKSHV